MHRLKLSLRFRGARTRACRVGTHADACVVLALLLLIFAASVFAQSESQIESDEVKRVGSHLSCQCGACNENLNCMMSAGQCHFCKPARTKIFGMQSSGMSDSQIVAAFV